MKLSNYLRLQSKNIFPQEKALYDNEIHDETLLKSDQNVTEMWLKCYCHVTEMWLKSDYHSVNILFTERHMFILWFLPIIKPRPRWAILSNLEKSVVRTPDSDLRRWILPSCQFTNSSRQIVTKHSSIFGKKGMFEVLWKK